MIKIQELIKNPGVHCVHLQSQTIVQNKQKREERRRKKKESRRKKELKEKMKITDNSVLKRMLN